MLAHLTGTTGGGTTPPPVAVTAIDPEHPDLPYTISGLGPYNAPTPCDIVVDSGTPESNVHPAVVDMGPGGWNGYRYWMAVTDYGGAHHGENPNILASHDGYHWVWPNGLVNPIWTVQTANDAAGTTPLNAVDYPTQLWNSDTELQYDAALGKLVCFWREMYQTSSGPERQWSSASSDGVHWDTPVIRLSTGTPTTQVQNMTSPCLVKVADNDWRMFCWGSSYNIRKATSMYGPWSAPESPTSAAQRWWHAGVWYDRSKGIYYGLGGDPTTIATSRDGYSWTLRGTLLTGTSGNWDAMMYRPYIVPHPDGVHFRVWYSTQGTWRTGYTIIPRSAWGD